MILLDRREGSADLLPLMPQGLAHLSTLPYTDACWNGIGPGGTQVLVGVERKRISDLLGCLKDGRFAGYQLPGMLGMCGYVYLVVEGMVRPGGVGELQQFKEWRDGAGGKWEGVRVHGTGKGGTPIEWTYDAWEHHLETLRRKTPLRVILTTNPTHTARLLVSLYTWWTVGGGWDGHKSHTGVHIPPDPHLRLVMEPVYRRTVLKVAQQLPGVRDVIADRVHDKFKTVRHMVAADVGEWQEVEGIGATKALSIWGALHGPVEMGVGVSEKPKPGRKRNVTKQAI